jgi:nicotinate-nucleotide adenylyltransferase
LSTERDRSGDKDNGEARRTVAEKKIGLFGGTFNPIHLGHLRGAEDIRESFGLDRVIFLPAAIPPHKVTKNVIDPLPRMEMVKLATVANPFFSVSDVEMKRSGNSYSIDTLRTFRERQADSFYFILGQDAFAEIETWKEYHELFFLCNFIVMAPSGFEKTSPGAQLPAVLTSSFHYNQEDRVWHHESGHTLHFKEITFLDISSTRIRELIENGKSVKYLVPSEVEAYIQAHGLYQREKRIKEKNF